MNKKFTLLLLVTVLLQWMSTERAQAMGPAVGGEITYQYINDTTYRFFYKYYRACSGFPESDEVSLCYRNTTCGSIWQTKRLYKTLNPPNGAPNGRMVDLGCPNQTNSCTDPNSTREMYREWWYSGIVVVPPCNKWIFSVNFHERDRNFLTNLQIQPSMDHNLYVEATLNNLTTGTSRQSSPYFTAPLPMYACDGSPFHYNNGVIDPDGDSLVYKIIQPRSATTDIFIICAGYPPLDMPFASAQYNLINNPLLTNNTFSLNSRTGDISFTPVGVQVAYLAYLVEKYRNGVLIGSAMRDARLDVKSCSSPTPQFQFNTASVSGGSMKGDTLLVCGNTEVKFCFNAATSVAGTVFKVKDNSSEVLKGAIVSYQNQGSANVTGCVQWVPGNNDTGFRYFIVSVKDSTCSATGSPLLQTYKVPVLVRPGAMIGARDTLICPGSSTLLSGSGGNQFSWSASPSNSGFSCTQCNSTTVTPKETTTYILTSNIANGCRTKDSVTVHLDRSNRVEASPDTIVLCDGGAYVQLSSEAFGPKPLRPISCAPYKEIKCTGAMDSVQLAENSNNSYSSNIFYGFVDYYGPFYQYYQTQRMQVIYRKEELKAKGMNSGTLLKLALNFGDVTFKGPDGTYQNVKISLRCTDKFEFSAPYQSEFETGLTEVFSASSVQIKAGWNEFEFTSAYDYDTSKHLIVQFCYNGVTPEYDATKPAMMPIYYVTTSYRSSLGAGQSSKGDACAGNLGTVRTYNRRPDIKFSYCRFSEGIFNYSWTPSTGMDNPGAAATGVFPDKTTWYTVTTKGKLGCEVKDSILVYVAEKDYSVAPRNSDVCLGEVVRLNGMGGYSYKWFDESFGAAPGFSCNVCDTPDVIAPLGDNNYKVIIADFYGCADTLDASIHVKPIPKTNILNNDTTINFGQKVSLVAEGAEFYQWSPEAYVSSVATPNTIASPPATTLFIVTGIVAGGCAVKDSVLIRVIVSENVFIPSAFSPNGDGVNDIFKINNLTLQRITAFNVFNRWGQEVYKAGVNENGWDGRYKGELQPLDTYYYMIQLALPDGKITTYKGDVTLVR